MKTMLILFGLLGNNWAMKIDVAANELVAQLCIPATNELYGERK